MWLKSGCNFIFNSAKQLSVQNTLLAATRGAKESPASLKNTRRNAVERQRRSVLYFQTRLHSEHNVGSLELKCFEHRSDTDPLAWIKRWFFFFHLVSRQQAEASRYVITCIINVEGRSEHLGSNAIRKTKVWTKSRNVQRRSAPWWTVLLRHSDRVSSFSFGRSSSVTCLKNRWSHSRTWSLTDNKKKTKQEVMFNALIRYKKFHRVIFLEMDQFPSKSAE